MGTGNVLAFSPPIYWYSEVLEAAAAALATAKDTPKIALAPSFDLLGVPSKSIMVLSISSCSNTERPCSASARTALTFATACETPLPM